MTAEVICNKHENRRQSYYQIQITIELENKTHPN